LRAQPEERLDRPESSGRGAPFLKFLALCFLLHLVLIAALLLEQWDAAELSLPQQEVAVEVVPESEVPRAEPPPPAAPEQPKPEEQKQQRQQPIKQKLTLDEKAAYDAPRAENKEEVKREAPEDRTQAQKLARPDERVAEKPEPRPEPKPSPLVEPRPSQQEEATAAHDEDNRDAEVIEQAAPKRGQKNDKRPIKPDAKAAPGDPRKTIADQIASLSPVPEFKLGGAAKAAPISGGTATPSYLSVVYGYIMRKFPHRSQRSIGGMIVFYVDPNGNVTHQALLQSSGSPGVDQDALAALRRAGPFPPTPTGSSVALTWTY
jgi:TonB family protein